MLTRLSKRQKIGISLNEKSVSPSYISASKLRNFFRNDMLVDWLEKYSPTEVNKNMFHNFLIQKGIDFEKKVIEELSKRHQVVFVSSVISDESVNKSISLILAGTPIMHSVPFRNNKNSTHGIIDLVVRNDYLSYICDVVPDLPDYTAPNLNGDYFYVAIDIKYSTVPLRADRTHILNSGCYRFYKSQLLLYTQALANYQGVFVPYAFVLGRRCDDILSCFHKLGVISYEDIDKDIIYQTRKAIEWVSELNSVEAKNWKLLPPSKEELYPNMCVDSGKWNSIKKHLAHELGDITNLWYCGVKNREIALKNKISSWRDKNCSSKTIGVNGTRARVIDKIIEINQQDKFKILPEKIESDIFGWRNVNREAYVDFETFGDFFSDFEDIENDQKTNMIFMIGIFDNEKGYIQFTAKDNTYEEEERIMDEFQRFVCREKYEKLWYWHAEVMIWDNAMDRHSDALDDELNSDWCDLAVLFRTEPIVIKDCFKFGLKEVAGCMKKHGMIDTFIKSDCNNGIDACVRAYDYYMVNESANRDETIIRDIQKYNEFDVRVLSEILNYLRKNL